MIEYKIRPVTRFVVTRYEDRGDVGSSVGKGEFDRFDIAYQVGYALAQHDCQQLHIPAGDERVQFPPSFLAQNAKTFDLVNGELSEPSSAQSIT